MDLLTEFFNSKNKSFKDYKSNYYIIQLFVLVARFLKNRKEINPLIGIIDYGCSNINAVKNILDSFAIKNKVLIDGNTTSSIDKYILPGVSAFDSSMRNIKKFNSWNNILEDISINKKHI